MTGTAIDQAVIDRALAEDLIDGPDVTTAATVPADQVARAHLTPRQAGVLAGGPLAAQVFRTVIGPAVTVEQLVPDGDPLVPGEPALLVQGPTGGLLTAERTALNLLTHLSGIATATRAWVDAVAGTGARIRDTRKTLPGLRALEKYAVRCGGGVNHRMSLGDAALIKDNHVAAAGSVTAAIKAVRALDPDIALEVEVDTLAQFDEAIGAGAELVLLDNFTLADTVEAVRRARALSRPVRLEASGGLTLDRARSVAATGVDFLAVGALTHSAPALDIGLDLVG
ncbi:carboxylating nicotinate-nucleotide diphosphorylase [Nakamurella sp.]|uniref:carboxylating nicotinate-nucleotide diphosphorylase n=1 Tax=Nakamurella sp. TaxID=1869182 RepID=UPI003B3A86F2